MRRSETLRLALLSVLFPLALSLISACACPREKAGASRPAAALVITPVSGQAKTPIVIRGSGFQPGEKIEVTMEVDGVPTELGEKPMVKEANEAGAFKTLSAIPLTAQPGLYAVKALGDRGTAAAAPLEVEPKPAARK